MHEVERTGARPQVSSCLCFEVSDLVYYYSSGNTPTGIQRVQQELASQYILRAGSDNVSFVIYDSGLQRWRSVSPQWLSTLISTARSFRGSLSSWQEEYNRIAEKLLTFPFAQFERGDWLV